MSTFPSESCSLAESIASLSASERAEIFQGLTEEQALAALYDWRGMWARPKQLMPPGDWRYWIVLAGRGFGKTRTGAEAVREIVSRGDVGRIHLIGPTASDARNVMVLGESGLMNVFPPSQRPDYQPSLRTIRFVNGAVAEIFSAEEPDRLRGPQCEWGWCDELAAWKYPETWDNFLFGLRLGRDPRAVITTTPRPTKIVKDLVADPHSVITRGSSYENPFLAQAFFDSIVRKYEGTRIGRQELLAELLDDVPGALWTRAMIDAGRIALKDVRWDLIVRTVVAIDPAVTSGESSDFTGIVVVALVRSGHVLILDDLTCRESPAGWARVAIEAYKKYRADRIVAEVNNGGDLVEGNLRAIAPEIPFRAVHASRGKAIRAEPVASLYEQRRAHHVGILADLEDQMCEFVPALRGEKASGSRADTTGAPRRRESPDRMDALVWAVTDLIVDPEEQEARFILGGGRPYTISAV